MGVAGGQDGSSVSDEEWERFLRESVAGAAGAPVELSARARSLERRSRQSPRRPVGRRRVGWYVTGFLAVVALLGVSLFPQRIVGWFGGGGQETAPLAAESERPRTAPGAEPELRPTLTEPFRGSPAARWADGAAGITVPAARATGWMDKAQVARALAQSKEFLVAAGLDSHVLRGERPSKAIAVLNPRQQDVQRYLRAALSAKAPTPETDPLLLFSRFRPDQASPLSVVPVDGDGASPGVRCREGFQVCLAQLAQRVVGRLAAQLQPCVGHAVPDYIDRGAGTPVRELLGTASQCATEQLLGFGVDVTGRLLGDVLNERDHGCGGHHHSHRLRHSQAVLCFPRRTGGLGPLHGLCGVQRDPGTSCQ